MAGEGWRRQEALDRMNQSYVHNPKRSCWREFFGQMEAEVAPDVFWRASLQGSSAQPEVLPERAPVLHTERCPAPTTTSKVDTAELDLLQSQWARSA